MQERAIHISSVDRQKIGKNIAEDFKIKFDTVLKLQNDMTHKMALDIRILTRWWSIMGNSHLCRWNVYLFRPE